MRRPRRTIELRVSYTGGNLASMSSVLDKWLSERIQIVLFTLRVPRELEVITREWESLNPKAELACTHHDGHSHEAVMWYVHHLPESMKTPKMCESNGTSRSTLEENYRRATTQEPIMNGGFTRISRAGNPKRTRPELPTDRILSNQRGLQRTKRSGGPKTPLCKGKGPENPGVVAPFPVADCRGNRMRAVVCASTRRSMSLLCCPTEFCRYSQ